MTQDSDFKRLVRRRMRKTGESYTTARSHLMGEKETPPSAYAGLAGMSDEAVSAKTGRTWPEWVRVLGNLGTELRTHRAMAAWLSEHEGLSPWWSQTVTVGYERIRGLRQVGQRSDGSYEVTKSRTLEASVSRLYEAFATKRGRSRWLGGAEPTVRTARRNRMVRLAWEDGSTVEVSFVAKGETRAQVSVQHAKLPDKATAEARKAFWTGRLSALRDLLHEGS